MNKDEKSLKELYEATLSALNGVGLGPHADDSAGGLGSPTLTKIDVKDVESSEDEECGDDHEVDMAKSELYKLAEYAPKLLDLIKNYDELEGWVQAKLTKASDYVSDIYHYLKYEQESKAKNQVEELPPAPMGGCGAPEIEVDVDEQPAGEMNDEEKDGVNDEVIKMLMSRF